MPEFIAITENPDLSTGVGSQPYDAEGVNKGYSPIIENGTLKRYLLNSYTARQLNLETTGNAGGVSNIMVTRKKHPKNTHQDLIHQMDHGVIIHETMGQGVNLTNGDYSQGAMGYYVKNGEIQYPIDNFTIAGNLKSMLRNIQALSDIDDCYHRIQVGSLLIPDMSIAGSQ